MLIEVEHFWVIMVEGIYASNFVPSQNLTKTIRKAGFWFGFGFWFFKSWNLQGKAERGGENSNEILEATRWMDE